MSLKSQKNCLNKKKKALKSLNNIMSSKSCENSLNKKESS
ncbi:hypothetical protein CBF_0721 [Clostridium botulinum F str. 230613]|uniref:Uncharacterized protein n=1 Tax=Clostridium botulinum (strain Langeland / NCTC 10281 / Type F) TaxID=441772 RepID=A7GB73_CLOBL|nr:hypothetical protein CLI_0754 [Clostridium botulinum F str. Langeland]ADF98495.1 hypothetical protein CBF_0721 [Clostridium botulinum F str. 230613]